MFLTNKKKTKICETLSILGPTYNYKILSGVCTFCYKKQKALIRPDRVYFITRGWLSTMSQTYTSLKAKRQVSYSVCHK